MHKRLPRLFKYRLHCWPYVPGMILFFMLYNQQSFHRDTLTVSQKTPLCDDSFVTHVKLVLEIYVTDLSISLFLCEPSSCHTVAWQWQCTMHTDDMLHVHCPVTNSTNAQRTCRSNQERLDSFFFTFPITTDCATLSNHYAIAYRYQHHTYFRNIAIIIIITLLTITHRCYSENNNSIPTTVGKKRITFCLSICFSINGIK